ncbi:hypothetical protein AZI86_05170 [Bdellovibrio bacteriovorus]|uniref:Prenyltransferase n=1 Tax=Bdellovibrio bacteriovorus TaxID=959 RepID=A0A150WPT7_BDEBC|nr:hypothetical protein [Bdellovibrio bacteriovorus]KYG66440.1 hypothetical protein AZI86_05170 [Bdellovibrio bacteriovorus]
MTDFKSALEESISYLSSFEAVESIKRDPYWPKWDTPWWHMAVLKELGLARQIPKITLDAMVHALQNHYLQFFPIRSEEVPPGTDSYRQIPCICSVGNMYQILFAAGVDVDRDLPWMRPWFVKYQLPDGGLNCDESVYTKTTPKSSIVSTICCLEAVLFCRHQDLTAEEVNFLNKGAEYLVRQKLFRRISNGDVIDNDWIEIRFPRFYDYDFLRGYYFLAKWKEASGFLIPVDLVEEVEKLVSAQMTDKGIQLRRYNLIDKRSYNPQADGTWKMGEVSEFNLFKAVSFDGAISEPLTKAWNEIKNISCVQ